MTIKEMFPCKYAKLDTGGGDSCTGLVICTKYRKVIWVDDCKQCEGYDSSKKCANCYHFNGEQGDKEQFCDKKEVYVNENGYCPHFKRKEKEQ